MDELNAFAGDLFRILPSLREEMRRAGDDDEPDAEMPTVWMGQAGRALSAVLSELPDQARREAFALVEREVAQGSELMRTGVSTGLLEALAHQVSAGRLEGALLAGLLGPESRAHIDAYDEFTLGRSSLDPS